MTNRYAKAYSFFIEINQIYPVGRPKSIKKPNKCTDYKFFRALVNFLWFLLLILNRVSFGFG